MPMSVADLFANWMADQEFSQWVSGDAIWKAFEAGYGFGREDAYENVLVTVQNVFKPPETAK